MNVSLVAVKKNHMSSIIEMLQSISDYRPNEKDYDQIWDKFHSQKNYFGLVALDKKLDVVGYGSLFILRNIRGGKIGQIEDITVQPNSRKKGIGKLLINALVQISLKEACYKVQLSCDENNLSFYQKSDFVKSGISLSKFFD
tara:strand:- start:690 stop:1115 length:426 start_codon:yes stop_codon:yes gene_type:complete